MAANINVLFVFDFDKTFLDDNTDIWILGCIPQLKLEQQVSDIHKKFECWTDMMNYMMSVLHDNGCTKQMVTERMRQIDPFRAMKSFFIKCKTRSSVDIVIASDSNTVFIETILNNHGCMESVKEIHTNPAVFNEEGKLIVTRYQSHTCNTCKHSLNMCKGSIVEAARSKNTYDKVVYVGDGKNDVCPCLKLTKNDHIIARQHFPLAKKLQERSGEVKAKLHVLDFDSEDTEELLLSLA